MRTLLKSDTYRMALWGHIAPFALWVGVILLLQSLESLAVCPRWLYPWSYAFKTFACAALFIWLKPWQFYSPLRLNHLPPALCVGVLVAAVWIMPEMPAAGRAFPRFQDFYHRWLIMMPGALPDYYNFDFYPALPPGHVSRAYMPHEAGWAMTLIKLVGSSCVIAVIEEFFFRGFFYRWLRRGRFWETPLATFDLQSFITVTAVFALEHDRWFAGLVAGAAYGWLAIRKDSVWAAAAAHFSTNLILGIYVIISGQYGFW